MTSGQKTQASQTVSEAAHGFNSGPKLKLESRAADLKKVLLGQRQLAAGVNGRQLSSSPSDPDPLTIKGSVVDKAQAPESSASGTASPSLSVRQDFNNDDIDDLIAGLLPREKSPERVGEAASASTSKVAPELVEKTKMHATNDSKGSVSTFMKTVHVSPTSLKVPTTGAQMTESPPSDSSPSKLLVSKEPVLNTATEMASLSSTSLGTVNDHETTAKAEQLTGAMDSGRLRSMIMSGSDANSQQYETLSFSTANTHANIRAPLRADEPSCRAVCINADQEAKDLQDWLLLTNYYDLPHRTQFLARRRRLAALEIERQKLLEEEKEEASLSVLRQFTPASLKAMTSLPASAASLLSYPGAVVSRDSPVLLSSSLPTISSSCVPSLLPTSPSPAYHAEISTALGGDKAIAGTDAVNTNGATIITQYISSAKRGREVNLAEEKNSTKHPRRAARTESTSGRAVGAVINPNKQKKANGAINADRQTANKKADASNPGAIQDTFKTPQRKNVPLKGTGDGVGSSSMERANNLRRQSFDRPGLADNRRTSTSLEEFPGTVRTADFARYSPPPRDLDSRGRSPQRSNNADRFDRFDKRNTIDRYTSEENGRRQWDDNQRQYQRPRFINSGQKGDTRFFMLKSFNEGNVRRAMADGVWTTQLKNEELLVTAFKKCRNVVFFFSVNKSRAFQGYARMESLPSASIVKPSWMDNIHWQTTEPFRIAWYNTTTTDYRHVAHLENDLNEHRSVIIGKDGQEIDDECGRRLMEELDVTADGEAAGSAAGRDRPDRFRTSPSLASRVTSGRP